MNWTESLQRALSLYEALWASADLYSGSVWYAGPEVITFSPYDSSETLVGLDAIAGHLSSRCAATALDTVHWEPSASWNTGNCGLTVARQQLWTVDRASGAREAREHVVVAATAGAGDRARLVHVAEAAPAAIVALTASYQRHALSAGEL